MGIDKTTAPDEYAATLIRVKARQLVGRYGFARSDREDIEQDLILHLLQKLRHFDPKRGSENTFVSRITNRKIASIIRQRTAAKRDFRRLTLIEDATERDRDDAWSVGPESTQDLEIDMTDAIRRLDSDSRRLCGLLRTGSITEAARRMGITRDAARGRIANLRKLLTDSGIEIYVRDE